MFTSSVGIYRCPSVKWKLGVKGPASLLTHTLVPVGNPVVQNTLGRWIAKTYLPAEGLYCYIYLFI